MPAGAAGRGAACESCHVDAAVRRGRPPQGAPAHPPAPGPRRQRQTQSRTPGRTFAALQGAGGCSACQAAAAVVVRRRRLGAPAPSSHQPVIPVTPPWSRAVVSAKPARPSGPGLAIVLWPIPAEQAVGGRWEAAAAAAGGHRRQQGLGSHPGALPTSDLPGDGCAAGLRGRRWRVAGGGAAAAVERSRESLGQAAKETGEEGRPNQPTPVCRRCATAWGTASPPMSAPIHTGAFS